MISWRPFVTPIIRWLFCLIIRWGCWSCYLRGSFGRNVGEIDDETDKSSIEVREIGENTYIVEGAMTLNDFNEHFDTELESDDVDTIAGYYLTGVGAIPTQEVKEHYSVINKDKHLEFINDKVKDGRVTKLKVIITAAPEEAEE